MVLFASTNAVRNAAAPAGWAIAGALAFLTLGLATINIYTQVGLITLIEVGALIVVFGFNAQFLTSWQPLSGGGLTAATAGGVLGAAFLAFYAFIGFEDMVNVAEEVRDVRRNLPLAILLLMAPPSGRPPTGPADWTAVWPICASRPPMRCATAPRSWTPSPWRRWRLAHRPRPPSCSSRRSHGSRTERRY